MIGFGDSEDEAWENLMKEIIDHMIKWVNETGRIDFILNIANADPLEAFRVAERYRRELERRHSKERGKT